MKMEYSTSAETLDFKKIGDIDWLLKNYNFIKIAESIDELIIIDVSREKGTTKNF